MDKRSSGEGLSVELYRADGGESCHQCVSKVCQLFVRCREINRHTLEAWCLSTFPGKSKQSMQDIQSRGTSYDSTTIFGRKKLCLRTSRTRRAANERETARARGWFVQPRSRSDRTSRSQSNRKDLGCFKQTHGFDTTVRPA